jgi:hypothetical protein
MTWLAPFVSVVLVAPLAAQSPQSLAAKLNGNKITLRACVQQGNHGSPGSLRQIVVVDSGGANAAPRVMYWFAKNLDGFRRYIGSQVEIVGAIYDVLVDAVELKASDGVFAEVELTPAAKTESADAGQTAGSAAAPAAAPADAPPSEDALTVVKAEVTSLRMLGQCL